MRYIPPKENNTAVVLAGLCLLAAAICFIMSALDNMPRGVLQIFAAGFAVAWIQITQRFILTSYEYELLTRTGFGEAVYYDGNVYTGEGGGLYDFAVVRVQGKHRRTVCSLSCATLLSVFRDDKKSREEAEAKFGRVNNVFNFRRNLFPSHPIACIFEFNGKIISVKLEADDVFEMALAARVRPKSEYGE